MGCVDSKGGVAIIRYGIVRYGVVRDALTVKEVLLPVSHGVV